MPIPHTMPALPKMAALPDPPSVHTGPELDNRRIAAGLIDLAVPLAFAALVVLASLSLTLGLGLVAVGWTLYYFFALESGEGQTLGKRVMNLRVVSGDGSPATMDQIAKRTVVRVLDGHVVGLIVMLASGERRQRLGDLLAGTVVAEADTATAPGDAADGRADAAPEPLEPSAQTSGSAPAPVPLAQPHEVRTFDPLAGPEPSVELDEPEPTVELDEPDFELPFQDFDPIVATESPGPLVELDREPLVEMEPDPTVPIEPDPAVETRPDPAVGGGPMVEPHDDPDPDLEVKPIETVSAIDLVMQDAEERQRDGR